MTSFGPLLMVCHTYYEEDARVRRQAESLIARGCAVDVVALRRPGTRQHEKIAGVRVHRLPVQHIQGGGLARYAAEYLAFAVRASFMAIALHRRRRYAVAQAHSLPDFLVFSLLPLRHAGVPLILDLHEAMPPFFATRFRSLGRSGAVQVLEIVERASIRVADTVITVNDALRTRLIRHGVPAADVHVILNSPSRSVFSPDRFPPRRFMEDGELRILYAGSLTPLYDVGVAIDALARLRAIGDGFRSTRLDIYGRGDSELALRARVTRLGLEPVVRFHGRVPIDAVAGAIAASDIGVSTTRLDGYTAMSMSTKVLEYLALHRVAVASRLPTLEQYFGSDGLAYYEPGDAESMAAVIQRLVSDASFRDRVLARGVERMRSMTWEEEAGRYAALVRHTASRAGRRRRNRRRGHG